MTDNTELKRLADELIAANDLFNDSPQDNEFGDAWSLANDRFTEAASPEVILALIDENERLESERADLWRGKRDVEATRDTKSAVIAELKAEIAGLRAGYEAYERVNAELKAEVEALREEVALGDKIIADRDRLLNMFDCPAHGQCIPYAMEQIEALRKDAEQWRALVGRAKSPVIGYTGCVICGAYTDHGGLPCPKTRAAANALAMESQRITPVEPLRVPHPLDAALGQGEQS